MDLNQRSNGAAREIIHMLRYSSTSQVSRSNSENLIKAGEYICRAPILYYSSAFYIFGGFIDDDNSNIIGRLDTSTMAWTKAGKLNEARRGHGAIFNVDIVIVAGGYGIKKTESCSIVNGSVFCVEQAPTLDDYVYYPEMYLVVDSFCKKLL